MEYLGQSGGGIHPRLANVQEPLRLDATCLSGSTVHASLIFLLSRDARSIRGAIKTADWLIDMGPEGGAGGGAVVGVGTPEDIAANPASHTGRYLARLL